MSKSELEVAIGTCDVVEYTVSTGSRAFYPDLLDLPVCSAEL